MPTTGAERPVEPPHLETERLILRRPVPGDAPAIQRLAGDWEVARYTARIPHPYPEGAAERWIATLADEDDMVFAVERRDDGAFLGCCGIMVEADGAAEVGYWIGRPFWGRGYATEALGAVVGMAFDRLGVDRVRASAMPANRASIRVQEKVGFAFVGEAEEPAPARGGPVKVELRVLTREAFERSRDSRPQDSPPPASRALPVVLVSAVALIDADGRVLLAQRPEGKPMAGLWEFPGGKVQDGETPEAALIRELHEELGIDVSESCLAPFTFASHRYETFHLLMPLYVCRKWQGQVRAREGQALAWVRPSRLGDYPMPPADKPLVPMLRDFL